MISIIKTINDSHYDIYFLVVDKNLDIELPKLKNFYKIYLPDGFVKNSGALLSLPQVQKFIKATSEKNQHHPAILPFKPSAKIDKICDENAWINLSNPAHLNRFLEDKIKFHQFCLDNKLPVIPSNIDSFNKKNYLKYSNNKPLIIQTHFGWAGNSTFFAPNYQSIENKIAENTLVKYSPFLKGDTITNNCCITRFGLIQSPPALQINSGFSTVGRQWPTNLNSHQQKIIKDLTEKFATAIAPLNYRGYFGLDILLSNDKAYLLECNPRLTASFAFYHSLEEKFQISSLLYLHLAELLDLDYSIDIELEQKRFDLPIVGKELTPRNKNNQIIKKI